MARLLCRRVVTYANHCELPGLQPLSCLPCVALPPERAAE
jgi:hypothetical protein